MAKISKAKDFEYKQEQYKIYKYPSKAVFIKKFENDSWNFVIAKTIIRKKLEELEPEKYSLEETGKTKFCHTLNASGLATSRLFPALLEQNQQKDGSVIIPDALVPFMGGIKVLYPKKK